MKNSKDWKKLFIDRLLQFGIKIVLLANRLPKSPAGFAIANQLVKSGTSVGANFVEAQDASSTKDFIQKLSIALREARETWYWLQIIQGAILLTSQEIKNELDECDQLIAIFVSSIRSSKIKSL